MIKPKKWSYLAGVLDGDGSIVVGRQKRAEGYNYHPWFCASGTDMRLAKWLVETFGGQYYKLRTVSSRHRTPFQWTGMGGGHISGLLGGVSPFLVMKQDRATNLVDFLKLGSFRSPAEREYYYDKSKELCAYTEPLTKDKPCFLGCSKLNHAYLAGLFDAEGTVSINASEHRATRYQLDFRLSNSDGRIMTWLQSRFGGSLSISYPANRQPAGTWRIPDRDKEQLLLATLPYMVVKRERAVLALEWIRHKDDGETVRQELYEKMRVLNTLGTSPTTNTPNCSDTEQKIESDLVGDHESVSLVTA